MKWVVAIPFLIAALVADMSVMPMFEFAGVSPAAVIVVVAFAALHGEAMAVRWFALLGGFFLDLSEPSLGGPFAPLYLIGPSTLGMLFAAEGMLALRGVLIRRNPLAVGAASFVFAFAAALFWTAWWTFRSWYPDSPPPWGESSALRQLGGQFLRAVASGALGIPLGWALLHFCGVWNFPTVLARSRTQGGSARIIRQ